ncbi:MAG: hypothetical protein V2I33_19400, partial [Kangiellaceae bacterium]|nr:hypothetical protein [Kangiellaceae bacterium]
VLCVGWIILALSWLAITTKLKEKFPNFVFSPKPEKIEDMIKFQLTRKPNFDFAMTLTTKNLQHYLNSLVYRRISHNK